jgi:hypothetical protein
LIGPNQVDREIGEPGEKTRVFLSYSRKDAAFTEKLAGALAARGYLPDYDRSTLDPANVETGISAEDEWWQRLQEMIGRADVMLFIVSPDSAASRVCDEEIAYARNLGKRIIPILRRPIDFGKAPPRLSALNVKITFVSDQDAAFTASLDELCGALDLDVVWYRECRRVTELAIRWAAEGQPADRLMSPADIRASERLLEKRPRTADPPAHVVTDFLDASRALREQEERRLRRTTGRAFVKPSGEALKEGDCEHALRLAAAGALLADDLELELLPELWSLAARSMFESRTGAVLNGHTGPVFAARFSPDGSRVATASNDGTARIWDASTGSIVCVLEGHEAAVWRAAFSSDGHRVATASIRRNGACLGCRDGRCACRIQGPRRKGARCCSICRRRAGRNGVIGQHGSRLERSDIPGSRGAEGARGPRAQCRHEPRRPDDLDSV